MSRTGMHNGPTNRWLVIVYPAAPVLRGDGMGTTSTHRGPDVKWVDADDAQEAAQKAGVSPGERAEVCNEADVFKFKRPKEAALVPGEVLA